MSWMLCRSCQGDPGDPAGWSAWENGCLEETLIKKLEIPRPELMFSMNPLGILADQMIGCSWMLSYEWHWFTVIFWIFARCCCFLCLWPCMDTSIWVGKMQLYRGSCFTYCFLPGISTAFSVCWMWSDCPQHKHLTLNRITDVSLVARYLHECMKWTETLPMQSGTGIACRDSVKQAICQKGASQIQPYLKLPSTQNQEECLVWHFWGSPDLPFPLL